MHLIALCYITSFAETLQQEVGPGGGPAALRSMSRPTSDARGWSRPAPPRLRRVSGLRRRQALHFAARRLDHEAHEYLRDARLQPLGVPLVQAHHVGDHPAVAGTRS